MRNDDDGALVVREEILQPCDGLDIQMVGRLVEQHDVRMTEQRLCEQHLDLLRVGEGCHGGVHDLVRVQTQTLKQLCRIGLDVPTVHLGKIRLQLGGADAVLVRKRVLGIQCVLLLHDLIQARIALNDGVQYGEVVECKVVLTQDGHTQVGVHDDLAAGRLQIAGQHTQQGGLARAVCADDAVAVALGKFQIDILEQRRAVKVDAQIEYS